MSIQVSDQLSIEMVYGIWVVTGGRIKKATFSRLHHACKYVVDNWAGNAAVQHETASMIDVIEHMGDRLHDAVVKVSRAHSADTKRLDWQTEQMRARKTWQVVHPVSFGVERGEHWVKAFDKSNFLRDAIDAAMEREAGAQESEV